MNRASDFWDGPKDQRNEQHGAANLMEKCLNPNDQNTYAPAITNTVMMIKPMMVMLCHERQGQMLYHVICGTGLHFEEPDPELSCDKKQRPVELNNKGRMQRSLPSPNQLFDQTFRTS
jgi:hypothetical protein